MQIIDSSNFTKEIFLQMKHQALEADFIAFDTEFSSVTSKRRFKTFDSRNSVYKKHRETVKDACLLQVGISFFSTKPNGSTEVSVYTVYTFPNKSEKRAKKHIENDCLAFLAAHDFDFIRCFKEGLDFNSLEKGLNILQALIKGKDPSAFVAEFPEQFKNPAIWERLEDLPHVHQVPAHPHIFLRGSYEVSELGTADQKAVELYEAFKNNPSEKVLKIEVHDKATLNYLSSPKSDFYKLVSEDEIAALSGQKTGIRLKKIVKKPPTGLIKNDDFHFKDLKHDESKINSLFDFYGLSLLFYYIIRHRKPIVLHNGLLDFLYIVQNFIADLPSDILGFVNLVQSLGLRVWDTKLLVSENKRVKGFPQFERTRLSSIVEKLRSSEDIMQNLIFPLKNETIDKEKTTKLSFVPINSNEDKLHDAGYDSFITGLIFLRLQKKFSIFKENQLIESHIPTKRIDLNVSLDDPSLSYNFESNEFCNKRSFFIVFPENFGEIDKLVSLISEHGSFKRDELENRIVFIYFTKMKEGVNVADIAAKINERFKELKAFLYEERQLIKDLIQW